MVLVERGKEDTHCLLFLEELQPLHLLLVMQEIDLINQRGLWEQGNELGWLTFAHLVKDSVRSAAIGTPFDGFSFDEFPSDLLGRKAVQDSMIN